MITSLIKIRELTNFGLMTISTIWCESCGKIFVITLVIIDITFLSKYIYPKEAWNIETLLFSIREQPQRDLS